MKNITAKILTLGVTAVLFTGCLTACKVTNNSKINANVKVNGEEVINTEIALGAGSWEAAKSNTVTDELKKYFDDAISKLDGYNHTPALLLGTQVVAGKNYCFLCTSTIQANSAATIMAPIPPIPAFAPPLRPRRSSTLLLSLLPVSFIFFYVFSS